MCLEKSNSTGAAIQICISFTFKLVLDDSYDLLTHPGTCTQFDLSMAC